jgi:hypothetical protein
MSRKSRAKSAREAKDKRMKKVAVGLAVVLVAVLAYEVPKVMHSGSSSATPPAVTTTTSTTATGTPVTATPGTAAAAVTPTGASTKLPNSDVSPRRTKSTLLSFSHFAGKDPFVQQVDNSTTAPTASTAAARSSGSSSGSGSSSSPQTKKSRTLAASGAARISVNGRIQTVRVGGSFPSSNPLFRLVRVSNGVARIGIANGSYASGAHTISLSLGRTLTLVDTADGIRYKIQLVSAAS